MGLLVERRVLAQQDRGQVHHAIVQSSRVSCRVVPIVGRLAPLLVASCWHFPRLHGGCCALDEGLPHKVLHTICRINGGRKNSRLLKPWAGCDQIDAMVGNAGRRHGRDFCFCVGSNCFERLRLVFQVVCCCSLSHLFFCWPLEFPRWEFPRCRDGFHHFPMTPYINFNLASCTVVTCPGTSMFCVTCPGTSMFCILKKRLLESQ